MSKKVIIGIAGEMASGKGTIAKYIEQKYSAQYWSFSRILRDLLDRLYINQSRKSLAALSKSVRELFGENLLAEVMRNDIEKSNQQTFVIEAVRREAEIEALRKIDATVVLLYIETDIKARYERLLARGENFGDTEKSFEEFQADHKLNTEQTIGVLKETADHIIINDGSLEDLQREVDGIIHKIKE